MTNVTADMKIVCQETFAPIVSIVSYETLDDAIRLVNESDLGLNAGIYTNILSDALYAADELQAGAVIINDIPTFRVDNMPYGGVKMSGYGREGIKWALEEMTDMKFISMKNRSKFASALFCDTMTKEQHEKGSCKNYAKQRCTNEPITYGSIASRITPRHK